MECQIIKYAKKLIKKMKWYDISLIKLATALFLLFIMTAWPRATNLLLAPEWYWYLGAAILISIPIFKKMFCNKK